MKSQQFHGPLNLQSTQAIDEYQVEDYRLSASMRQKTVVNFALKCTASLKIPTNYETTPQIYFEMQAIDEYQVEDYRLSASMNALNVAQSLVIFSGLAAGLVVCTKVRGALIPIVKKREGSWSYSPARRRAWWCATRCVMP